MGREKISFSSSDQTQTGDGLLFIRSFANLLNGGHKQADQDRDDRNHDQEFDQRESALSPRVICCLPVVYECPRRRTGNGIDLIQGHIFLLKNLSIPDLVTPWSRYF